VKTTYAFRRETLVEEARDQLQEVAADDQPLGKWRLVGDQQELSKEIVFTADRPSGIVVLMHPTYSNLSNLAEPDGYTEFQDRAEQLATAHNAIDVDFDWEQQACSYCGEE
jgi:hypothetical protein